MVDPTKVTNYNRTQAELEEFLLFCVLVAGKNATTTSKNLERLLDYGRDFSKGSPFEIIKALGRKEYSKSSTWLGMWGGQEAPTPSEESVLAGLLKGFGFGCYNLKAKGIWITSTSAPDLKTCTPEQLEGIPGVGMKTARYFILHSRENAKVACLDTHVLKWLAYYTGFEVPKHTPTRKKYLELEKAFLKIAEAMNTTPADLDLKIWNKSRGSDEESLAQDP